MLVSIIIPTYNRAALLDETLSSVVAQSYPHWECIVVDDGSTDDTAAVAARFAPHVQYLRQANAGPAAARNRGLSEAVGDAVMFLDSDDLLLPSALHQLVEALQTSPDAGIAYGGFHVMHADGRLGHLPGAPRLSPKSGKEVSHEAPAYGMSVEGAILPDLLQHDVMVMGGTLLRPGVVEAVGTFDSSLDYMEHWEFFLRAAQRGIAFAPTATPVLRIRMHGGNLSRDFEGMLQARLALVDRYVPRDHPDAKAIRRRARSNAQLVLGVCLCAVGEVASGFRQLRAALPTHSLPEEAYDTLTEQACRQAFATLRPERRIYALLTRLGASSNARSAKHHILSRFYRMRARRGVGPRDWSQSAWHLACAVVCRPALGRPYARRLLGRLRWPQSA